MGLLAPVGVGLSAGQAGLTGVGFAAGNLLRFAAGTRSVTLPPPAWVGADHARRLVPGLAADRLRGALVGFDGQLTDDARLVVAVARTAAAFSSGVPYGTSMNLAPSDSTCSFTLGRTSLASITAPRRFAVAIACKPATPTPITNTRAAEIVPAAVIIIGKARPYSDAASSTAL